MSVAAGRLFAAHRLALASLLLLYLTLAIGYQRAVPIFEAPDEPSHIQYVVFVAEQGRLPRMLGRPEVPGEGMQAPLYYALLAPLFAAISRDDPTLLSTLDQANLWAYRLAPLYPVPAGARIQMRGETQGSGRIFRVDPALDYLRGLRWGSLAFGVLALICTYSAALRISGTARFAVLCTVLFAFSPQFLFVSGYVNNDSACAALGAAAFLLFSVAAQRERVGRASYLAAAVLFGVALGTKHSALPAAAVCGVALFALDRRTFSMRLKDTALAAAVALVLILPIAWTNLDRFAAPFGVSAVMDSAGSLEGAEIYGGLSTYLRSVYPYVMFRTYWATFGWMNIVAPDWVYVALFALTWTGLLGFALGWRQDRAALRAPVPGATAPAALHRSLWLRRYLLATLLATVAAHLWVNLQTVAPQGRHLFGAAPHLAALLALGICNIGGGRGFAVSRWGGATVCALMFGVSLFCLTRLLEPIYAVLD